MAGLLPTGFPAWWGPGLAGYNNWTRPSGRQSTEAAGLLSLSPSVTACQYSAWSASTI